MDIKNLKSKYDYLLSQEVITPFGIDNKKIENLKYFLTSDFFNDNNSDTSTVKIKFIFSNDFIYITKILNFDERSFTVDVEKLDFYNLDNELIESNIDTNLNTNTSHKFNIVPEGIKIVDIQEDTDDMDDAFTYIIKLKK